MTGAGSDSDKQASSVGSVPATTTADNGEAYRVKSELSSSFPDDKPQAAMIEHSSSPPPEPSILTEFSPSDQRRIIRHIDRRLVVTVGFMYCVSLMDRTNLGSANIAGMSADLGLDIGSRYSIATLLFFIPYVLLQPPSTVLVRRIGPRIHLALITLLWGGVMIGMGFVKSWGALAVTRAVLGILEAGFFPSCVYLLSTWYTRYELGKRNALFYLVGCVASAFSGILAAGIMQMKGLQGLNGWSWIFIIQGILTCVIAVVGYWLLVDFPDSKRATWQFLNDRERAWVVARVQADRGDAVLLPFHLASYLRCGLDWKIWAYGMLFFSTTTITYALAYFLPIILVGNLKFSIVQAQCLVAPPYALTGLVTFAESYVSDRYRLRGPVVVFNNILCLIGLPIVGFHPRAAVRYFGIFLLTAGANANVPAVMSYQANNIRGQWKRAFASATFVGFGGIGGIAGSLVFRSQDAPAYRPGIYACIAVSLLSLLLVGALSASFYLSHKKVDRGELELETEDENFQPGFRYTY